MVRSKSEVEQQLQTTRTMLSSQRMSTAYGSADDVTLMVFTLGYLAALEWLGGIDGAFEINVLNTQMVESFTNRGSN